MVKTLKNLFLAIFLISILTLPYFVFANPLAEMENVANQGGYSVEDVDETTFSSMLGMVIQAMLGFLGIIFIVLILWAGYNWMTAGGNEEKVSKARTTIIRSIIGLIIILASYAIFEFVFIRIIFGSSGAAVGP